MKTKIEMGSFNIKRSDIVIEIPSIKIEAEYEVKEVSGLYSIAKDMAEEVPAIIEKFTKAILDSLDRLEDVIQDKKADRLISQAIMEMDND